MNRIDLEWFLIRWVLAWRVYSTFSLFGLQGAPLVQLVQLVLEVQVRPSSVEESCPIFWHGGERCVILVIAFGGRVRKSKRDEFVWQDDKLVRAVCDGWSK